MKKLLILSSAVLALAACTNENLVGEVNKTTDKENAVIGFNSFNFNMSRGPQHTHAESADELGKNFVVVGFKGSATTAANTTYVFDHYNVNYVASTAGTTISNTDDWEYVGQDMKVRGTNPAASLAQAGALAQTVKYWDHEAASHDFLAFSMGKGVDDGAGNITYATPTAIDKDNLATAAYTLTGNAQTLGECYISDMTTVEEANYSVAPVEMTFRHLTSKLRLAFYETIPGYVVKDVKFRETLTDAHDPATSTTGTLIGADAFNDEGTLTVYFPTTGTDNVANSDYNKAHVKFTPAASGTSSKMTFGAVDYCNAAEDVIAAGTTYLAQSATACSYVKDATGVAGGYVTVLPHENDSKVLSIQVDYTLVPTDGTASEIKVYGARADIPAQYTAWKSGYAYTYLFKLSQNTNGHTGTNVDDKGLTAITFDAVVLDDEMNGLQQTITTVATPSITTYGYDPATKAPITSGNEYKTGDQIYATAVESSISKAPAKLYTVTLTKPAGAKAQPAQEINEASVANCLQNGKQYKYTAVAAGTTLATGTTYYDADHQPVAGDDATVAAEGEYYTRAEAADGTEWVVVDANGWILTAAAAASTVVAQVPTSANTSITVPALMWTAGASGTIYVVEYVATDASKNYKIVRIQ